MTKLELVPELLDDPTQYEETEVDDEVEETNESETKTRPTDPWYVLRDAVVRGIRSIRSRLFFSTGNALSPVVEDIAQGVLLDFLEHPKKLENRTPEQRIGYGWMAGRYSAISYLKRLRSDGELPPSLDSSDGIQNCQFDPFFANKFPKPVEEQSLDPLKPNFYDEVQGWLGYEECRDALQSLPEGQRTFIIDYAQRKLDNSRKNFFSQNEISRAAKITSKLRTIVENKKQSEG